MAEFRTLVQTLKPVEVVCLYSENHKEYVKILKNLHVKPIMTYITLDKLPNIAETEQLAKMYAGKNCNSDEKQQYPDGLDQMFPMLLKD